MPTIIKSVPWNQNTNTFGNESITFNFGTSQVDGFENIVYDRVISSIENIIKDEFNVPVIDEHRGNQSFVIDPQDDTLIEYFASGQSRNYDINIIYTLLKGGGYKSVKKQLTKMAEHLKRLLHNNSNYSPSGSYKYHDGRVESVDYEQDEENLDIWRANLSFNCTVTEVY
tara:strand:- start:198 stop:707 length:510 start_codon:yes stop_codon:yes gene_type:complete